MQVCVCELINTGELINEANLIYTKPSPCTPVHGHVHQLVVCPTRFISDHPHVMSLLMQVSGHDAHL